MPTTAPNVRYVIANWKMNLTLADITKWLETFRNTEFAKNPTSAKKIILAPSFPYLGIMAELAKTAQIGLAAQNIGDDEKGAHTGQTGILQIKDFCDYALIGHSELNEAFEVSLKKRDMCLEHGIIPIMCVAKLENIKAAYKPGTIATWEDPASISKNGLSNAKTATEIAADIARCRENLPNDAVLLYGGSVNKEKRHRVERNSRT